MQLGASRSRKPFLSAVPTQLRAVRADKQEGSTMKANGNTILITGGGSGIGQALAERLHQAGNTVVIAGRRQDALDAVSNGREGMHTMILDVEDAGTIRDFAERLLSEHPRLNILINNAGIMRREDLTRSRDLRDAEATIATNLLGPIRLTDALIDHLVQQPDAAIVNLSSGLAFVPLAGTPTYNATKAAIHSYSVSLRQQLKDQVEVIEIAPPGVRTELTPGQSQAEEFVPLDQFADDVMQLLQQQPTPAEILVKEVESLRWAEKNGTFDQMVEMLSVH